MIGTFFRWNVRISDRIESWLPDTFNFSLLERHRRQTAKYCASGTGTRLLDVGGGRSCLYVPYLAPDADIEIVALDIMRNSSPTHTRACWPLPTPQSPCRSHRHRSISW